jgi:hypothetical protein
LYLVASAPTRRTPREQRPRRYLWSVFQALLICSSPGPIFVERGIALASADDPARDPFHKPRDDERHYPRQSILRPVSNTPPRKRFRMNAPGVCPWLNPRANGESSSRETAWVHHDRTPWRPLRRNSLENFLSDPRRSIRRDNAVRRPRIPRKSHRPTESTRAFMSPKTAAGPVLRHLDHVSLRRPNHDLLGCGIQVPSLLGPLPHRLNRLAQVLLLVRLRPTPRSRQDSDLHWRGPPGTT